MPLTAGSRLGPYQIVESIGAGGMGEVYRARDIKLGRDVALKILPGSFTTDPERTARFRREAQILAALNHPNIAHIYGFDEIEGAHFLVMEFVDGESLDKRIGRGSIPLDDALPIARQIADALEAAHEKGIIHRDLKPSNIALTRDGTVKVLDFGLAKAVETTSTSSRDAMNSPTITSPARMTGVGIILGTASYMSPEQARGKPVDRRTDVWAFGCVLYEMVTAHQAFESGETVSDAIASVLSRDPAWNTIPAETPSSIRRLLRRCLQKDPQNRLPHIGVARLEIDEARTATALDAAGTPTRRDSSETLRSKVRSARPWTVAAIALITASALLVRRTPGRVPERTAPLRLSVDSGADVIIGTTAASVAMSPDGSMVGTWSDDGTIVFSLAAGGLLRVS